MLPERFWESFGLRSPHANLILTQEKRRFERMRAFLVPVPFWSPKVANMSPFGHVLGGFWRYSSILFGACLLVSFLVAFFVAF